MKRIGLLLVFAFLLTAPVAARGGDRITPWPSGTLLFLQNSNKLVETFTGSDLAHVAIVIRHAKESWVYEATPVKVRRMTWDEYNAALAQLNSRRKRKIRVWAYPPKRHFPTSTVTDMKSYLDEQLGRRYSVKGIVRGKRGDGIHCSQLASQTLRRTKKLPLQNCHLITPGELAHEIGSYYPVRKEITVPLTSDRRKWCQRTWDSVAGCFRWCGWSCRETFSWLY